MLIIFPSNKMVQLSLESCISLVKSQEYMYIFILLALVSLVVIIHQTLIFETTISTDILLGIMECTIGGILALYMVYTLSSTQMLWRFILPISAYLVGVGIMDIKRADLANPHIAHLLLFIGLCVGLVVINVGMYIYKDRSSGSKSESSYKNDYTQFINRGQ